MLFKMLLKQVYCCHLLSAQEIFGNSKFDFFPFLSNNCQKMGNMRAGTEIANRCIRHITSYNIEGFHEFSIIRLVTYDFLFDFMIFPYDVALLNRHEGKHSESKNKTYVNVFTITAATISNGSEKITTVLDLEIWFYFSECKVSAQCIISQNFLETCGSFFSIHFSQAF